MKMLEFEEVLNDLLAVLEPGMIVYTLVRTYGNKIDRIDDEGIWVMTRKSSPGSSLVPKSMFEKAVSYMIEQGTVNQKVMTGELRLMRSALVMASLARLP